MSISIVYATSRGGRREFTFNNGEELAAHVQANHPALFVGCPKTDDEKYAEKRERLLFRPFSMPNDGDKNRKVKSAA